MRAIIFTILLFTFSNIAQAENKGYIFYLHGAIVQQQGADAESPAYGKYLYKDIVNTFRNYGYTVISEVRPKNATAGDYAHKVAGQVDSLLSNGIPQHHITIIGASMGAYITLKIAARLKAQNINYVLMGICSNSTKEEYDGKKLCGNFYSIYETSDFAGSCNDMFNGRDCVKRFQEQTLSTGKKHGFLYQPYPVWVDPLMQWIAEQNKD